MTENNYHHENLHRELIEAGIRMINEQGEQGLSLRKIAAACNVSPAAPYSHFKDKGELCRAMQNYVENLLVEQMQELIDSYEYPLQPQLIIDLGKCYVMFFINNPQYFSFLFSQTYVYADLDLDGNRDDTFAPFELFRKTAIPILKALGVAEHRFEDAMISSWAHVHGLAAIANMKNIHYSKNWEEKIEDFLSDRKE